jgi:murein DD-endopeptidase MepM/ murein hydrolase activator NlpD
LFRLKAEHLKLKTLLLGYLSILSFSGGQAQIPDTPAEIRLQFPTANAYLLENCPEKFYQPTVSKRLISGMYGFVRSSEPEPARYFNLFHEGIDIQPTHRDTKGEPLDPVMAAAAGLVVYTNLKPTLSNYGRYLIIRHSYGTHDLYTTYGHLASIQVKEGQKIESGQTIGQMGWSGNVGSRERAHLHFETGFLVNKDYAGWYRKVGLGFEPRPTPNEHGNFNGLNYIGVDPSTLLVACASGKPLTLNEIFKNLKPLFRVRLPASHDFFDWQKRFPEHVEGGLSLPLPASWEVDCARTGLPLRFKRSTQSCSSPELLWFDESLSLQNSFNKGLIQKVKGQRCLSRHGLKWFSLLAWEG